MTQLATFTFTNEKGKTTLISAADIARVEEVTEGLIVAHVYLRGGTVLKSQTTVANLQTAIAALWSAYLEALGDPV